MKKWVVAIDTILLVKGNTMDEAIESARKLFIEALTEKVVEFMVEEEDD